MSDQPDAPLEERPQTYTLPEDGSALSAEERELPPTDALLDETVIEEDLTDSEDDDETAAAEPPTEGTVA